MDRKQLLGLPPAQRLALFSPRLLFLFSSLFHPCPTALNLIPLRTCLRLGRIALLLDCCTRRFHPAWQWILSTLLFQNLMQVRCSRTNNGLCTRFALYLTCRRAFAYVYSLKSILGFSLTSLRLPAPPLSKRGGHLSLWLGIPQISQAPGNRTEAANRPTARITQNLCLDTFCFFFFFFFVLFSLSTFNFLFPLFGWALYIHGR